MKRILRPWVLALALALVGPFARGQDGAESLPGRTYVNSASDLKLHFEAHIDRVAQLGLALYDANPAEFGGVPRELVQKFLSVHDQTKIDDSIEFKKRFWSSGSEGEPSFIDRLYQLYGRGYAYANDPANPHAKATVVALNSTDKRVGEAFFQDNGLLNADGSPNPIAQELLRIERIADVVDRNSDPVAMEEFAIKEQLPLSTFIKQPIDLQLATNLKQSYAALTSNRTFLASIRQAGSPCKALRIQAALH